jgi:hypothetical protein
MNSKATIQERAQLSGTSITITGASFNGVTAIHFGWDSSSSIRGHTSTYTITGEPCGNVHPDVIVDDREVQTS